MGFNMAFRSLWRSDTSGWRLSVLYSESVLYFSMSRVGVHGRWCTNGVWNLSWRSRDTLRFPLVFRQVQCSFVSVLVGFRITMIQLYFFQNAGILYLLTSNVLSHIS